MRPTPTSYGSGLSQPGSCEIRDNIGSRSLCARCQANGQEFGKARHGVCDFDMLAPRPAPPKCSKKSTHERDSLQHQKGSAPKQTIPDRSGQQRSSPVCLQQEHAQHRQEQPKRITVQTQRNVHIRTGLRICFVIFHHGKTENLEHT